MTRAVEAEVAFKELYVCRELLKIQSQGESSAGHNAHLSDKIIEKLLSLNVPVFETTEAVFAKISYGEREEGLLAVGALRQRSFRDFPSAACPFFVVIERVEKPGNLGAILRTCDGAGVDGVIVCDGKTDIYNPNVIRASLGTVFSNTVVTGTNQEAIDFLKSRNIKICAALPQAKTIYTEENLNRAVAVIVGSEQDGLTKFWTERADVKVRIPMKGRADSLNVAASTAVLVYEVIRQRMNNR